MKVSADMINRLKDVAEDLFYEYEAVAIRVQETPFSLGEINHVSHVWIDGEDTGKVLNGICGISAEHAEEVFKSPFAVQYFGDHAAIIAGNHYEFGEDFGEIIISDPVVVDIIA